MAEDRQVLKEKIKLKKEIGLIEAQIEATVKSKDEKVEENKKVETDIASVEQDNIKLEEQIQQLEEEIAELDTEFKEAQLTAGRLRKMTKMSNERLENEESNIKKLTRELNNLNEALDKVRRDIKREMDERKNLEYQLKTTKGRIEEMQKSFMANFFVTRNLKKNERYFPKGQTAEDMARAEAARLERERDEAETAAAAAKANKAEEAKARAEAKTKAGQAPVEEATEDDLDLSM